MTALVKNHWYTENKAMVFDSGVDKRITVLEQLMLRHSEREEQEMQLTNKQLDDINTSIARLSEALIQQSNRIEIASRDTLDKVRLEYATKKELNGGLNSLRDSAKIMWLAIISFSAIIAFVANLFIQYIK